MSPSVHLRGGVYVVVTIKWLTARGRRPDGVAVCDYGVHSQAAEECKRLAVVPLVRGAEAEEHCPPGDVGHLARRHRRRPRVATKAEEGGGQVAPDQGGNR